jgi:carboxyl-terminal processing protease
MLDESAWNMYLNQDDPVIKTTLDVFRRDAAFPQKPSAVEKPAKKVAAAKTQIPYNELQLSSPNILAVYA